LEITPLRIDYRNRRFCLNDRFHPNAKRDSTPLSDLISRARSGFRAAFGPDSTQYQQAGGTRRSKRKPAKRKVSTPVLP
jgi:hypothetical protein